MFPLQASGLLSRSHFPLSLPSCRSFRSAPRNGFAPSCACKCLHRTVLHSLSSQPPNHAGGVHPRPSSENALSVLVVGMLAGPFRRTYHCSCLRQERASVSTSARILPVSGITFSFLPTWFGGTASILHCSLWEMTVTWKTSVSFSLCSSWGLP